jgi:hypothetical protein
VPQDLGGIRHRHHRHLAGRAAAFGIVDAPLMLAEQIVGPQAVGWQIEQNIGPRTGAFSDCRAILSVSGRNCEVRTPTGLDAQPGIGARRSKILCDGGARCRGSGDAPSATRNSDRVINRINFSFQLCQRCTIVNISLVNTGSLAVTRNFHSK